MSRRREPSDEGLRHALTVVNDPAAEEGALDEAIATLAPLAAAPVPPADFSQRVMRALRQAPLSNERVHLTTPEPDWAHIAAITATAAAIACGTIAISGPTQVVVKTVAILVQSGLSILTSLNVGLQIWRTTATVGTTLAGSMLSPAAAIVFSATLLVGLLSLAALTQLLSSQQEPSQ